MSSRPAQPAPAASPSARTRLLDAALRLIRRQGFARTSIDDLCRDAGVTKGAFFHHFASKDALGVAAADYWSVTTEALFAAAPYHGHADPLARVFAYLDFRRDLIAGDVADFTCLVGTMVQEVHDTSPAIRAACAASITAHAATLEADLAAAMADHGITGVDAADLALHFQTVLQGAFVVAKAKASAEVARTGVAHLKRYLTLLFQPSGD